MVKVRGKKVKLTPSEYVIKDLVGPKGKRKEKLSKNTTLTNDNAEDDNVVGNNNEVLLPETRKSDEAPIPITGKKWVNKQRVLVFGSRGISFRGRHIMENLRRLLPHTKKDSKMDKKDKLVAINEIAEMKNCNKTIFLEGRKREDIYMWISNIPEGPSMKFLMENVSTMEELRFTGNCLKGSRAILSFDPTFDAHSHYQLMKEMLVQIFGTPYHFPKSQPFIDHVFTFTVMDHRIWFRNFQILEETGSLVEIGPRFCLNPIAIFEKSFHGATIWNNPHYVSPNKYRAMLKKANEGKYVNKLTQKLENDLTKPDIPSQLDPSDEIFHIDEEEMES